MLISRVAGLIFTPISSIQELSLLFIPTRSCYYLCVDVRGHVGVSLSFVEEAGV